MGKFLRYESEKRRALVSGHGQKIGGEKKRNTASGSEQVGDDPAE